MMRCCVLGILLLFAGCGGASAQAIILPNAQTQFVDANGAPFAGGKVYFYVPGTTTPATTYVDQGLTTPNTNPVTLDAAGRAQIWGQGLYREVLYDQFGNIIWDQITGAQFGTFVTFACTGTCTAPTQPFATSNTSIATTQFVQDALASPQIFTMSSGAAIPASACGKYVLASGGFYTISLSTPASYVATNRPNCVMHVLNIDNDSGKTMNVSGQSNGGFGYNGCGVGNICPLQGIDYISDGASWRVFRNDPWRPQSSPDLYAATNGVNTNDCLAAARPCLLQFVCIARGMIDLSAGNGAVILPHLHLADGTYTGPDGTDLCDIVGNGGADSGALTFIDGNSGTPTNVVLSTPLNGVGLFTKDFSSVEISNFELSVAGANATEISGAQGSIVDVLGGMQFVCPGTNGIGFHFSQGAHLNLDAGFNFFHPSLSCTTGVLFDIASNADLLTANIPINVFFTDTGTDSFTVATLVNEGGYINSGTIAFHLSGAVSGTRVQNIGIGTGGTNSSGCLRSNGSGSFNSIYPGNVSIAVPIGVCTDFDITDVFANLPTPANIFRGTMFQISNGSTNVWGANVAGGGANVITVVNNGTNYTVVGK